METVPTKIAKVAFYLSCVTLPGAVGSTIAGIWTDSEHWADTAAFLWVLLGVPWIIAFLAWFIVDGG